MYDHEMLRRRIGKSMESVQAWVEKNGYKAYEPFDGLSSHLRPLTFKNHFAERVLQQLVKRSPLNIRPLLGISPRDSTKGRGYMARGYLAIFRLTGQSAYRLRAISMLEWLDQNRSPYYPHHSWGNHFAFSGRKIRTPELEPIIVWTSLIGQAYLDAYEILGDEKWLDIASSVCNWIVSVPREKTPEGLCLSYVAQGQVSIHNSNMLGAAMLARAGALRGRDEWIEIAGQAMAYSCARQNEGGSWYYAEYPDCRWIDNFHTGYNLDSLKCFRDATGISRFDDALARGFAFYARNFFEPSGAPRYYHDNLYPIDIQCAAQAIDTLATFVPFSPKSLGLCAKVALWTIDHMQDPSGYFYYSKTPLFLNKTPMLHWGQATMFKSLANLLSRM